MPHVVKITVDEYGEKIASPKWCYVKEVSGGNTALCSGMYFGFGESGAKFIEKQGKITCPECIAIIKEIKSIKL